MSTPSQNPFTASRIRQARPSYSVELVDVATRLYVCRDCGQAVRLGVTDPLPIGWRALPGATLGEWVYVCGAHPVRRGRR